MKIILGLAKSNLDLKGAKRTKTEFDFLKLLFAVRECEDVKKGYLLVMDKKIKDTIDNNWASKYGMLKNEVEVIVAPLSGENYNSLKAEKNRNIQGMLEGTLGGNGKNSIVKVSDSLAKEILINEINKREKTSLYPNSVLGINWHYCRVVEE